MGAGLESLDDLAARSAAELLEIYRGARTPTIAEVEGDYDGRMLAVLNVGPAQAALSWLAAQRLFPWRGKRFKALSADQGEGTNLVLGEGSSGRPLFRFDTYVARSRAGEFDALQIDYGGGDNPFFVRAIRDEMRAVAPGLYLGQAYVVVGSTAHLALYFGLQRRSAPGS